MSALRPLNKYLNVDGPNGKKIIEIDPDLEHVPEKCGRFSDKNMLKLKGIEHFR